MVYLSFKLTNECKKTATNTTVLIVDDEPNIVVAVEFLLQQEGYAVLKAFDGNTALALATQHQPSLVILDVMMPSMTGFEVARKIRENPLLEDTHIIFLTAKGTTADKFEGYANGAEAYLAKPFDNQKLMDTINEMVTYG
ncbi:MAG: response regulator [Saprospiraceae bacterium]|nr:response regulator [Saprospiraceae bacterium]